MKNLNSQHVETELLIWNFILCDIIGKGMRIGNHGLFLILNKKKNSRDREREFFLFWNFPPIGFRLFPPPQPSHKRVE